MKPRVVIAGAIVGLIAICAAAAVAYSLTAQGQAQQAGNTVPDMHYARGLVFDRQGDLLPGVDVTLHIMGYDASSGTTKELYNVTMKTSGQPYPGMFDSGLIDVPEGEAYSYLDASITDHGATLQGRSDNFTLRSGGFSKVIVMNPPGHANASSVAGYAVSSIGTPLLKQKVTLHLMGYDSAGVPVELSSRTVMTTGKSDLGQVNAGLFLFNDVRTPHGAQYFYVDTNVTKNGTAYYGKSNNYSIAAAGTATASIVVRMPFDWYKVQGYVVDSTGTGLSGVNVTLHIMGYDKTSTIPKELGSSLETTTGLPNAGQFTFNRCMMPEGAKYLYVDTNVTKNGTTYYGRGDNYSITPNMSVTSNIVLKVPAST